MSMTYDTYLRAIDAHHNAGQAVLLTSRPGEGKSSLVRQLTHRSTDLVGAMPIGGAVELRLAGKYAEAINGLPYRNSVTVDGVDYATMSTSVPQWALELHDLAASDTRIVYLVLDEVNLAFPDTQSPLQDLLLTRTLPNGFRLPATTRFILMANPSSEVSRVYPLTDAMTNRLAHLTFDPDHSQWCESLVSGFPGEPELGDTQRRWRTVIAAFLTANPTATYESPTDTDRAAGAWASKRSWTELAHCLALYGDPDTLATMDDVRLHARALIGERHAPAFVAWVRGNTLPDFRTLAAEPERIDGLDPTQLHIALVNAVVQAESFARTAGGEVERLHSPTSTVTDLIRIINRAATVSPETVVPYLKRVVSLALKTHGPRSVNPNLPGDGGVDPDESLDYESIQTITATQRELEEALLAASLA